MKTAETVHINIIEKINFDINKTSVKLTLIERVSVISNPHFCLFFFHFVFTEAKFQKPWKLEKFFCCKCFGRPKTGANLQLYFQLQT